MKYLLVTLLLASFLNPLMAQSSQAPILPEKKAQRLEIDAALTFTSPSDVVAYLQQHTPSWTNDHQLVLEANKVSAYGKHWLFSHLYKGLPVVNSSIKVSLTNDGHFLSGFSSLDVLEAKVGTNSPSESQLGAPSWMAINGSLEPVYVSVRVQQSGVKEQWVLDQQGNMLARRTLDLLFSGKDTLVQSKLFRPDPLTTAQKAYGADSNAWVNLNGQDYPLLNAQRQSVTMSLKFNNDTFFTENKFARIEDLEAPNIAPYSSKSSNFDFTRSTDVFKELMCLYHIETLQNYLHSINFDSIANFFMHVDAHAFGGQDQSRFSLNQDNLPSLYIGIGGVPDGEDADVIVHEYTHGINYYIAPNTTNGIERMSVEEGTCDFNACQYSKAISTYNWRQVFNWDGHNTYWPGRDANSTKKYPTNVTSDYYSNSEIWSSLLNDISLDLGRDITTKIVFNAVYDFADNISMQDAAYLLLQSDNTVYQGAHISTLKTRLTQRGFNATLAVDAVAHHPNFKLINTIGFANGTGTLTAEAPSGTLLKFSIYSLNGDQVMTGKWEEQPHLEPASFGSGIYLLKVETAEGVFYEKLVRY